MSPTENNCNSSSLGWQLCLIIVTSSFCSGGFCFPWWPKKFHVSSHESEEKKASREVKLLVTHVKQTVNDVAAGAVAKSEYNERFSFNIMRMR